MALPVPEPGLVISYGYLWRHEHDVGGEEGRKRRPCVIVLAVENHDAKTTVTVAPVTHRQPDNAAACVEIPLPVKKHLKLDGERSWVIVSEVNQFTWPGFDLTPIPGNKERYDYGFLPPKLFEQVKAKLLDSFLKSRTSVTPRD